MSTSRPVAPSKTIHIAFHPLTVIRSINSFNPRLDSTTTNSQHHRTNPTTTTSNKSWVAAHQNPAWKTDT